MSFRNLSIMTGILLFGLLLAACGDGMSRGIVLTGEGRIGANNARNTRENAQDKLRIAIEDELGPRFTVKVHIPELPIWIEERGVRDGEWRWQSISGVITIIPPSGQSLSDQTLAEYQRAALKYLEDKLARKGAGLAKLEILVEAQPVVSQTSTPSVLVVPAGPVQRSYVIQPGDTLADISSAFYGSPIHWRTIVGANSGLDPGALKPGTAIVIPVVAAESVDPTPR